MDVCKLKYGLVVRTGLVRTVTSKLEAIRSLVETILHVQPTVSLQDIANVECCSPFGTSEDASPDGSVVFGATASGSQDRVGRMSCLKLTGCNEAIIIFGKSDRHGGRRASFDDVG